MTRKRKDVGDGEHEIIIRTMGGKFEKTSLTIDGKEINVKSVYVAGDDVNDLDISVVLAVSKATKMQEQLNKAQAQRVIEGGEEPAPYTTNAIGFQIPSDDEQYYEDECRAKK